MYSNDYLYGLLLEARHQDLLRETEQRRLAAQLLGRRTSTSRKAMYGLGTLLIKLGTRLQQYDRLTEPANDLV